MVVNINRLTESLERLSESTMPLNERFDDSFPKWLKDRLAMMGNLYYNKGYDWVRNNVDWRERPNYSNARDERYSYDSDRSLFSKALNAGIDFTNTKVIEGPIPEKRTDERLKEPNIPIWYFDNGTKTGQVYIEGINDTELYEPTGKPFKYMPMKDKIAFAKGFAYIDGSKLDPNTITGKRADRATMKQELSKIPNYTRKGTKEDDLFGNHSWGVGYDKSGYSLENPKRYEKALERIKGKKVYDYLQKYHDEILDSKRKVMDAYAIMDPNDSSIRDVKEVIQYLSYAQNNYNGYLQKVEDVLANSYLSEEEKLDNCARVIRDLKNDSYIRNVRDYGSRVFLSDIDWD